MASPESAVLDQRAAWAGVLDELEAGLASTGEAGAAWTPPAGLGLIPDVLLERAQQLRLAQRARIAELEDARRQAAAHLTALRAIPALRDGGPSVYLDVAG